MIPHGRWPCVGNPASDHRFEVALRAQKVGRSVAQHHAGSGRVVGGVGEANAGEGLSMPGAISQVAPHIGIGTGVLALQLRTPPLHAMAAATLQQLAGDRDVFLGVGISSPAVAGQWHGAGYTDRPIAQVRESGEPVSLEAMTPFERKVVHDAVAAAGLSSESEGVEPRRYVVVLPG